MKRVFLLIFISSIAKLALAGEPLYPVTGIPAELKKNAHSIMRLSETTNRIISTKEIRTTVHTVVTVLDEEGEKHAALVLSYDKLREIRNISGARYNLLGIQDAKLKQSEVKDYAGTGDESLITDNRYKFFTFGSSTIFPYTVEYEVEYRYNSAYYLGDWIPQKFESQAIEKAVLNVISPQGIAIHYKTLNANQEPVIADAKEGKSYSWTLSGIPAAKSEQYAIPLRERTQGILLSPGEFDYGGFHGTSNSWKELGNFFYSINAGRDALPANVKAKVHEIADPLPTREEKIKALYKYLQKNFRYISIQLGIGGFQTIDAATTAKTGYGDCKSLSNMMYSILKEAGIPSNTVLVQGGSSPYKVPVDFPSDYFNHVILCVPNGKDSVWLECTSSIASAGYMGSFTGNRPVLIMDSVNSKLVYTPSYSIADNKQISVIEAEVNDTGHIMISAVMKSTGQQQEDISDFVNSVSKARQLEYLRESLSLASYDVLSYDVTANNGKLPAVTEILKIKGNNYATVTGKRMFLTPNMLHRTALKLEEDSLRNSPIRFEMAYSDIDTCYIRIPAGYQLEGLPKPQQLKTKFGSFDMSISIKDKTTITYIRKLDIEAGMFPASDYKELAAFRNAIYKSDRTRIVFVKEQ
ncbi:DUF3857 domain-containing protein [Chitinophaga sp. Hz27]|uniref:DUF3857 domain-containing protein n=1 Tax=Chitinophaga sp. Hz27 TaxID=3347169 RepID=UPI0035DD47B7